LAGGPKGLSDAELLAILLRNGVKGKDAVSLARELLAKFGGLRGLLSAGKNDLQKEKGLGAAKIASLLAAKEIVNRSLRENIISKSLLNDPGAVIDYLASSLREEKREIFKVLFLNKAHCFIDELDLFQGTIDSTAVYPREVLKAALNRHASALILVHNHPSGRLEPSREDREITRELQAACRHAGIKVLDHLIVGGDGYFSFEEKGLMEA
jgi:DNA repair protein RadC